MIILKSAYFSKFFMTQKLIGNLPYFLHDLILHSFRKKLTDSFKKIIILINIDKINRNFNET